MTFWDWIWLISAVVAFPWYCSRVITERFDAWDKVGICLWLLVAFLAILKAAVS